ncbi:hypothetical protein T484DRAFT_3503636 [Baffinella frigidus]|nr:hypothetical protein T484DRAFT_3503636 [Cryptophyta sp. CCMP2293]
MNTRPDEIVLSQVEDLRAQLAGEEGKLALARDEIADLTLARAQEVNLVKMKLETIMRHSDLREREAQAQIDRLSAACEAAASEKAALLASHTEELAEQEETHEAEMRALEARGSQREHDARRELEGVERGSESLRTQLAHLHAQAALLRKAMESRAADRERSAVDAEAHPCPPPS